MKKKVLFIILPYLITEKKYARRSFLTMPYGVLSIATFIKDIADVEIFDCNLYNIPYGKLTDKLLTFSPDICAISMMFDNSYQSLKTVINQIKNYELLEQRDIQILLGGAATTYSYKEIFEQNPDIDAICYGEGEWPVMNYIATGNFDIGWATKENLNPEKLPVYNLDEVIDIDYSLIDIERYQQDIEEAYSPWMHGKEGKRQFFIITSRGCPFSCTFCINSNNPDKTIRYASVDSIIAHVEKLIDKYQMNVLTFYDDQILYDRARAKELFLRLKDYNLRIEMPNGISPAFLDEELLRYMFHAGVDAIYLALESGSQEVLRMMHKPVNLMHVCELIPILRKFNFFVYVFLVIGMPGETDEHRKKTVDFIRDIKPDIISPKIASPVYGSKLRELCIQKGFISNDRQKVGNFEITDAVINTPEYTAEYLNNFCLDFMHQINFTENYRMSIGDYAVAAHYFEYVLNKYPNEIYARCALAEAKELMR